MNMKTVEGLVGARSNINLSDTAMGVYRQAAQKGDTATAERALGYAGDMVDQAEAYETKAEEGMKADAKEQKEKAKADQEKIIEKRKEDRKELEARIEQSRTPDSDTVEISGDVVFLSGVSVLGVIMIAIALSCISIMVRKPKEILSRMS